MDSLRIPFSNQMMSHIYISHLHQIAFHDFLCGSLHYLAPAHEDGPYPTLQSPHQVVYTLFTQ